MYVLMMRMTDSFDFVYNVYNATKDRGKIDGYDFEFLRFEILSEFASCCVSC